MATLLRGGLVLAEAGAQPARADLLIEADRIAGLGPDLAAGPDVRVVDARDRLIIPGLVNAHTHAHNNLVKGAVDGLPLELWLQYLTPRLLNRTPREVYVGAALGALEMVRTGTTCACDMAQAAPWATDETLDAVAQAYRDIGLRASIAPQILDLPFTATLAGLERYLPADLADEIGRRPAVPTVEVLATVRRAVDRWHGAADGRLRFGVGPTIATVCSEALLAGCGELARERGLTLQTHLAETKWEAYTARERYGASFTARLDQLGLLGPNTILAHSVWLDRTDVELIAARGASVSHNPVSNLKLGAGLAPLLALRAAGCNVALGTDGAAANDNQNLFGPLRLAALLPRVEDPNYDRWPGAADLLAMATVNGARAAGFGDEIGSLAPGRKADLVLLDLGSTYYHPRNDLTRQLVHCETGRSVRSVFVDGRAVLDEGRITTVDEAALLAEADEIGARVAADLPDRLAFVERLMPHLRRAYFDVQRAEWPVNRYSGEAFRALPER